MRALYINGHVYISTEDVAEYIHRHTGLSITHITKGMAKIHEFKFEAIELRTKSGRTKRILEIKNKGFMSKKINTSGLIPLMTRSPEERKEIARKGGIASGEARRRRRDWMLEFYESIGYKKKRIRQKMKEQPRTPEELEAAEAQCVKIDEMIDAYEKRIEKIEQSINQ